MTRAKSFEELVERYGKPWESEDAKMKFERDFMTLWRADVIEQKACLSLKLPIRKIYCNRDLVPVLDTALTLLADRGLVSEIKTFDGCWNIRSIRGRTDRWSIHSFGLALDLNAAENPLGGPVTFSKDFRDTMRDAGLICGADFKRIDAMHFQWAENC